MEAFGGGAGLNLYEQEVIETRTYTVRYTVEADSIEEAERKVLSGDTIKEEELKCEGVQNRDTWGDITLVDNTEDIGVLIEHAIEERRNFGD